MQKLTILILITLVLSPLLSAEEESIILDRDILYWKPAGPDIIIPDTYFTPDLIQYPESAFRSTLFFPLSKTVTAVPQEEDTEFYDEDLLLNWSPPLLFKVDEQKRDHTITGYDSYPYGSGIILEGRGDLLSYEGGANFAYGKNHPHWLNGSIALDSSLHHLDTSLAWRIGDDPALLSQYQWDFSFSPTEQSVFRFGSRAQSLFPVENFNSLSEKKSHLSENHQWNVSVLSGTDINLNVFNLETNISGEYRDELNDSYWRFAPEVLLYKNYTGKTGDWSLSGGILADLYTDGQDIQYFPQLLVNYINYGSWSFYLESKAEELDSSQIHNFLTEEVYNSPEIAFYRYSRQETGFFIATELIQSKVGGGYATGNFPEIEQKILKSDRMTLFFIESSISWNYKAGKVTELNCYADYQDRGSLRFFVENRWLWKKTLDKSAFGFVLRAGNRELLRGYRYFFDDSSDLLTGGGIEIEFLKPLQMAAYVDYLPLNKSAEGRVELSLAY